MAKRDRRYVCQACGAIHSRWAGHCAECGSWNSIVEELVEGAAARRPRGKTPAVPLVGLDGDTAPAPHRPTGIGELDRVLGGGLVPGAAILIGGDPGIGKSTLLLQLSSRARDGGAVIYISGEEAVDQIRLRARRLGIDGAGILIAAASDVAEILAAVEDRLAAGTSGQAVVLIDSIQTMQIAGLESAAGTVAQVRASAQELIREAKKRGFVLVLVGHVTKDGLIAGPRVLEHMVDAVLYFEGDRGHQFRILRAVKNRFGPSDEIGVFEMTDQGLAEVPNPSALFLADRRGDVSGAAVFAGMEGTRPVLVEVQALIGSAAPGNARRAVVGWDGGRLAMVLAVLEARCGLSLGGRDVYLNVAGGLRINEPAADLAVATALVSAAEGSALPADTVVFGEIGLSGEVRAVGQAEARIKEAAKLGFERVLMPAGRAPRKTEAGIDVVALPHLADLMAYCGGRTG